MTPFIIAEAGSTHDGVMARALALVEVAAQAGANAVKFQWMSSPERVAARMNAPDALDVYRRYQWPSTWFPSLREAANDHKLELMCTVDLPEDVHVIAPYVDRWKIASFGCMDTGFIELHRAIDKTKPMVISTGATTAQEAQRWWDYQFSRDELWRLHCVSAYPAPVEEQNLAVIRTYRYAGLSDHTTSVEMGAWAVCAGARVLEKHVRLDDTDPANPDYAVALAPADFAEYVRRARQAWLAVGNGEKRVMPSEDANRRHRYVHG